MDLPYSIEKCKIHNTFDNELLKCVFSGGKMVDEVLKHRLEHKLLSWLNELNGIIAFKPLITLPQKCTYQSYYEYFENFNQKHNIF